MKKLLLATASVALMSGAASAEDIKIGVLLAFTGPLLNGERRAGEVLSGIEGQAIALVRLDRVVEGDLTADGVSVRTERPDWIGAAGDPPPT